MLLRILLAGILALPAVLLSIVLIPVQVVLSLPSVFLLLWRVEGDESKNKKKKKKETTASSLSTSSSTTDLRRHVIITGGSSGIGLGAACEAASNGFDVTLLARDSKKLAAAKSHILSKTTSSAIITTRSVDVTDYASLEVAAKEMFATTEKQQYSTIHVFVCAGQAEPNYFHKLDAATLQRQVALNLLGSMYTAHAFVTYLPVGSSFTFCSSMAGQVGVFGYGAYSPTKFALRGLAEVLAMEFRHVYWQVAYPPDTNTPGFDQENLHKPQETILVSDAGGAVAADPMVIGKTMLQEAIKQHPRFHVYFTAEGFLLAILCSGFSPVTTLWDGVVQVSGLLPIVRWMALFYVADWKRMIGTFQTNKQQQQESDGEIISTPPNETIKREEGNKAD